MGPVLLCKYYGGIIGYLGGRWLGIPKRLSAKIEEISPDLVKKPSGMVLGFVVLFGILPLPSYPRGSGRLRGPWKFFAASSIRAVKVAAVLGTLIAGQTTGGNPMTVHFSRTSLFASILVLGLGCTEPPSAPEQYQGDDVFFEEMDAEDSPNEAILELDNGLQTRPISAQLSRGSSWGGHSPIWWSTLSITRSGRIECRWDELHREEPHHVEIWRTLAGSTFRKHFLISNCTSGNLFLKKRTPPASTKGARFPRSRNPGSLELGRIGNDGNPRKGAISMLRTEIGPVLRIGRGCWKRPNWIMRFWM